jgi:hypothetical protein
MVHSTLHALEMHVGHQTQQKLYQRNGDMSKDRQHIKNEFPKTFMVSSGKAARNHPNSSVALTGSGFVDSFTASS